MVKLDNIDNIKLMAECIFPDYANEVEFPLSPKIYMAAKRFPRQDITEINRKFDCPFLEMYQGAHAWTCKRCGARVHIAFASSESLAEEAANWSISAESGLGDSYSA